MDDIRRIVAEAPQKIPTKMLEYFKSIVEDRKNIANYIPDVEVPKGYEKRDWATRYGLVGGWAHDPDLLYIKLIEDYYITNKGRLDKKFKELLAVLMGEANRCRRCVTIHSASARMIGVEDEQIRIVRNFEERKSELPEKTRKALEFAVKVSTDHVKVTENDIDELRKVGYTDPEIVELVVAALVYTEYAKFNYVFDLESGVSWDVGK